MPISEPCADRAVALSLVSCPPGQAERLARALVEARLAACVSALAQRSVYRWQGAVEAADETLLLIKHPADAAGALRAAIVQAHPYELPEIVTVKLHEVHPPYHDWILASCA